MVKKITYIAFDNTEFDNEQECTQYESTLRGLTNKLVMFNIKGARMDVTIDNLAIAFNDAWYLLIKDNLMFDEIYYLRDLGLNVPSEKGKYYYSGEHERWVDYEDEINRVRLCANMYDVLESEM